MKPSPVVLMMTILLATATAANAQTPPPAPPRTQFAPPLPPPGTYGQVVERVEPTCTAPAWPVQAWQHMVIAWQRARVVCSPDQSHAACCDAAVKAAHYAAGVAGSVKCCEVAQTPKACACVKACACCEMCKAKKDDSARTQAQPMRPDMLQRIAGLHGITPPPPFPVVGLPPCLPPAQDAGIVQVMPVPGVRVIQVVQIVHAIKPVHFVTPELDAHCERMHHHGDIVILEGNVLLLCKKHAQPIRIEAQRVLVNMKDGTFSVESDAQPMPPVSSFGVQRTSAGSPEAQVITDKKRIVYPANGLVVEPAPIAIPHSTVPSTHWAPTSPPRGTECPVEGLWRLMQSPAPPAERIFQIEIAPIPGR